MSFSRQEWKIESRESSYKAVAVEVKDDGGLDNAVKLLGSVQILILKEELTAFSSTTPNFHTFSSLLHSLS